MHLRTGTTFRRLALAASLIVPLTAQAQAPKVLRVAMTASDVPTTTGMPNNGSEGMRFLGFPVFEPLVNWDLSRADRPADIMPGLATAWTQDPADGRKWRFDLRQGVKFHDGSDFGADSVIWNFDRFYKNDSPQSMPPAPRWPAAGSRS
ncbi:ABC transporter substrate-binding protein [Paeniroseomonas aquatica]|uniref:ABC transporter substrate-binding protein n=1 Tax=Paeniroseomonas aquatica TaxID=373043 RepID=UPI003618AA4A